MKTAAATMILFSGLAMAFPLVAADKQPPLVDENLTAKAELVVRARRLSFEGADKYAHFRVRVLEVYKNALPLPSGGRQALPEELTVSAYSWKTGVPEGDSTLYLERYNKESDTGLWKLVGGE